MSSPSFTEERLRSFLDSNQVMRERLCLAIMPTLGPYTQERPRRPKGGPDGGRDIEAIHDGSIVVWGAVGFRNGGGNDQKARRDAQTKFRSDLDLALKENPGLQGFVFFTNVDLTPGTVKKLKEETSARGIVLADIFDLERLRHALDSPEGLIARLQYLDIPMSPTEQIALVSKFGDQLQDAVLARFDRVERTLSQMEKFLGYQKPLFRLDVFVALNEQRTSTEIGDEAILLEFVGLQDINKTLFCLCVNNPSHDRAKSELVCNSHIWLEEKKEKIISFASSIGLSLTTMTSFCELSLTTGGHRVTIADLTHVRLNAFLTAGICPLVSHLIVDANGYELFNCRVTGLEECSVEMPGSVAFGGEDAKWIAGIQNVTRNLLFDPPNPSGRLLQLTRISAK